MWVRYVINNDYDSLKKIDSKAFNPANTMLNYSFSMLERGITKITHSSDFEDYLGLVFSYSVQHK